MRNYTKIHCSATADRSERDPYHPRHTKIDMNNVDRKIDHPIHADRSERDPYRNRRRQQVSSFARRASAEETADEMRR